VRSSRVWRRDSTRRSRASCCWWSSSVWRVMACVERLSSRMASLISWSLRI
jgi:hypothetical protein